MDARRIVIVGGGFAGSTLARCLERTLPSDSELFLLSQDNCITYTPLLPEVVGASLQPGHAVAPLRVMLKRTRFMMVTVSDIDLEAREVHYLGEGAGVIRYDHLVLACGTMGDLDVVPGMARYALPLKTLGDAHFLRNRVIVRMEQAQLQPDPDARRWLTSFIVVGGGFSGVAVAGAIGRFLDSARRYYSGLSPEDGRVVLLHGGYRLLPELSPSLGKLALTKMRKHVDVRPDTFVIAVDPQGVRLESGDEVRGGTVICTIGTAPSPLLAELPLPRERGRVRTAPDMSVPRFPGVWALGDCASVPNGHDHRPSPPTAQFAARQARQLADNLRRALQGVPTRPFSFRPRGQMSSIGHTNAVAKVFGVRISGFVAWLLWRGVYLMKMPTLARKIELYFEWNWELLFPPDLAHMGFARTRRGAKQVQIRPKEEHRHAFMRNAETGASRRDR